MTPFWGYPKELAKGPQSAGCYEAPPPHLLETAAKAQPAGASRAVGAKQKRRAAKGQAGWGGGRSALSPPGFLECWEDGGRVTSHLDSSVSHGSMATSSCSLNTVACFCLMSDLSDIQISYGSRQQEADNLRKLMVHVPQPILLMRKLRTRERKPFTIVTQ